MRRAPRRRLAEDAKCRPWQPDLRSRPRHVIAGPQTLRSRDLRVCFLALSRAPTRVAVASARPPPPGSCLIATTKLVRDNPQLRFDFIPDAGDLERPA